MVAHTTDDILRALDVAPAGPVQFEDPRTHVRYVLIPQESYQRMQLIDPAPHANGSQAADWSDAKNDRRCDLIDKEIAGTLTLDEAIELDRLQQEAYEHRHRVAPLPLEDLRELHRSLQERAARAEGTK